MTSRVLPATRYLNATTHESSLNSYHHHPFNAHAFHLLAPLLTTARLQHRLKAYGSHSSPRTAGTYLHEVRQDPSAHGMGVAGGERGSYRAGTTSGACSLISRLIICAYIHLVRVFQLSRCHSMYSGLRARAHEHQHLPESILRASAHPRSPLSIFAPDLGAHQNHRCVCCSQNRVYAHTSTW